MTKIFFITLNIILIFSLYFLDTWYEEETALVKKINKKYTKNIKELRTITKINKWLQTEVKGDLIPLSKESEYIDLQLIKFFDMYASKYNFKVKKFIYKDHFAHFLEIEYTLPRDSYKKLISFLHQKYGTGYRVLKSFKVDQNSLNGEMLLVQPYISHRVNISNRRSANDISK